MPDHTLKAYDRELESLERRIAEMGGIAEKMVVDAMDALSQAAARAGEARASQASASESMRARCG